MKPLEVDAVQTFSRAAKPRVTRMHDARFTDVLISTEAPVVRKSIQPHDVLAAGPTQHRAPAQKE